MPDNCLNTYMFFRIHTFRTVEELCQRFSQWRNMALPVLIIKFLSFLLWKKTLYFLFLARLILINHKLNEWKSEHAFSHSYSKALPWNKETDFASCSRASTISAWCYPLADLLFVPSLISQPPTVLAVQVSSRQVSVCFLLAIWLGARLLLCSD